MSATDLSTAPVSIDSVQLTHSEEPVATVDQSSQSTAVSDNAAVSSSSSDVVDQKRATHEKIEKDDDDLVDMDADLASCDKTDDEESLIQKFTGINLQKPDIVQILQFPQHTLRQQMTRKNAILRQVHQNYYVLPQYQTSAYSSFAKFGFLVGTILTNVYHFSQNWYIFGCVAVFFCVFYLVIMTDAKSQNLHIRKQEQLRFRNYINYQAQIDSRLSRTQTDVRSFGGRPPNVVRDAIATAEQPPRSVSKRRSGSRSNQQRAVVTQPPTLPNPPPKQMPMQARIDVSKTLEHGFDPRRKPTIDQTVVVQRNVHSSVRPSSRSRRT